jgi:hypothetical protein
MSDLSWQAVRPVLVAACDAYERADYGASSRDVSAILGREPTDRETLVVLSFLKDEGFLDAENSIDQISPENILEDIVPKEKALQQVRAWPMPGGGDEAVAKLLAILDQRITETDDEDERTRLERFRGATLDVGKEVLTSVLSKMATQGL